MSASTPTRIITDTLRYEDGYVDGYRARDAEFAAAQAAGLEVPSLHAARLDEVLEHAKQIAPWPLPEPLTVGVELVPDWPPVSVPFDREQA